MKSASPIQLLRHPQFARTVLTAAVLGMLGMMGLQGQGDLQQQEQELVSVVEFQNNFYPLVQGMY